MDREAVRRKIKNLLALAESDNENEALAAVQAARKLMMKYHISVEEEKGKEGIQKNIAVKELRFKRMPMKWHHLMLAWILAKNFRCRTFCRPKPVICTCFLGFEEDAHAALMLMEYLVRFMEQGAAAYRGAKVRNMVGETDFAWELTMRLRNRTGRRDMRSWRPYPGK